MVVGRSVRVESCVPAVYIHFNGKVGVVLAAQGANIDDAILHNICMHIAFTNPQAITRRANARRRRGQGEEDVHRAGEGLRQAGGHSGQDRHRQDGPLVQQERVLLEQPFVKDDKKKTVAEVLKAAGAQIASFVRLQVGVA